MQIKHYERAHCNLFRQPPIDFSVVDADIQERILTAWEKGNSVDGVINHLLKDPTLINQIASQIGENLDFQREIQLETAQARRETALEQYRREKAERADQLKTTYDPLITAQEARVGETKKKVEETRQNYSAAQTRLEEMRGRINERLKKVGGEKGLEQLIKIQEGLDETPKPGETMPQTSKIPPTSQPKYDTTPAIQKKETPDINTGQTQMGQQTLIETSYKKESRIKRIGTKIWEILNYKLW